MALRNGKEPKFRSVKASKDSSHWGLTAGTGVERAANKDLVSQEDQFSSVQFSSVAHVWLFAPPWTGARQASLSRPPSPTAGVYPNTCPSSRWCHPTISSSVVPFSSCPQSFPASGSFQMNQLLASGGQSIGVSASTSDGWMASLIQWTRTWANSGRWWGTGKPGVLQFTGSQELATTWRLNNNIAWFKFGWSEKYMCNWRYILCVLQNRIIMTHL